MRRSLVIAAAHLQQRSSSLPPPHFSSHPPPFLYIHRHDLWASRGGHYDADEEEDVDAALPDKRPQPLAQPAWKTPVPEAG